MVRPRGFSAMCARDEEELRRRGLLGSAYACLVIAILTGNLAKYGNSLYFVGTPNPWVGPLDAENPP